jgi:acetate---CoA ligase (ADP-forming)
MSLGDLLRPSSIAVIGASPRSFVGSVALNNLRALSFSGPVVAVNPKYDEVCGYPTVAAVSEIGTPVDVAVIQIGVGAVIPAVEEAVEAGIRNFIIPGGGFTDSGELATALVSDLKAMAESYGIQVVGPNTMGVVDLVSGAAPYVGTVTDSVRPGPVAVVSQSGAVCEALVNAGGRIPISTAVSTGSEATVDIADYLDFFAGDPATTAILAFVETVRRPDRLLGSLRRLEEVGKRIAVLAVGRSDVARSGVMSHSGRLAPDHRVVRAALSQGGAVVVDDLDGLMAVGDLFAAGIESVGNRIALVVNSGGEGNLLADLATDAGIDLPPLSQDGAQRLMAGWPRFRPANPLDPWGVADYRDVYPTVIATAAAEDVDVVIVSQDQQTTCGRYEQQLGLDLARYLDEACRAHSRTGVFLSPTSQDPPRSLSDQCRRDGVALMRGAAPALRALGLLARRRWSLKRPSPPDTGSRFSELPHIDGLVPELEALEVLDRLGIGTPRHATADTPEECFRVAAEIGYPIVLKGLGAGVAHKTELGLVQTGIASEPQLEKALDSLETRGDDAGLDIDYLIVTRRMPPRPDVRIHGGRRPGRRVGGAAGSRRGPHR